MSLPKIALVLCMLDRLQMSSQNKLLAGSFIVFLILYFTLNKKNTKPRTPDVIYADTLIPKGYVLVPIELANLNAVAGLINQYGVIDLYGGDSPENSVQIATRIKILRAPLNPNHYAVLVPEDLSKQIMRFKGPFWASIQNRSTASTPRTSHDITKSEVVSAITDKPDSQIKNRIINPGNFNKIEIEYYKKEEEL